jgi:tetratricopeptide (TPR) repeat protein
MLLKSAVRRVLFAAVVSVFAAVSLYAQQGGGGTAGGASGGAGGGTAPTTGGGANRPTTGTLPNSTTTPRNPTPTTPPPVIFVSGQVVLNDGTPISEPVVIERVCGTRTYREAYTDSHGYFSFQLGQNRDVLPDASTDVFPTPGVTGFGQNSSFGGFDNTGADLSQTALASCELRAVLAGYRSDTISLATRRYLDNPDVGVIVLHNTVNAPGLTTSATTALAPKDARKSYEKALEAVRHSRPDDAQKELLKAVGVYPKFAAAWFQLGLVYEQRDHLQDARDAYSKAIAADANFVNPYERVYMLAAKEAKWQDVADTTERVLRLNPYDFPAAYYFNAVANLQLKKLNAAEKSARESVKLIGAQAQPRANFLLGVILANKGEFTEAAESFRTFLKVDPNSPDRDRAEKMLVEAERLAKSSADQPPAPPKAQ